MRLRWPVAWVAGARCCALPPGAVAVVGGAQRSKHLRAMIVWRSHVIDVCCGGPAPVWVACQ